MDSFDNLRILGAFVLPGYIAVATYEISRSLSKEHKDSDWARAAQSFVYGIVILGIAKQLGYAFNLKFLFVDSGTGFVPRLPGFALLFCIGFILGLILSPAREFLKIFTVWINGKMFYTLLNFIRDTIPKQFKIRRR